MKAVVGAKGPSRDLLRDYTTSNFAKVRLKLYLPGVHCRKPEQEDGGEDVERVHHGQPEHQVVETAQGSFPSEQRDTGQVPRQTQTSESNL